MLTVITRQGDFRGVTCSCSGQGGWGPIPTWPGRKVHEVTGWSSDISGYSRQDICLHMSPDRVAQ